MSLFPDLPQGPRVYETCAGCGFAAAIAEGVLARAEAAGLGPEAIARIEIYTASRRGARVIGERLAAKARKEGRGLLSPRVLALSDIGQHPAAALAGLAPAVPDLRRRLTLARLIMATGDANLGEPRAAADLAGALAALLDEFHGEGASLKSLSDLAPDAFADHWRETLRFLDILRSAWPAVLAASGETDPEARRAASVDAVLAAWGASPPAHPVLFAGAAGGVAANTRFAAAVAALPQGAVVLPPLDHDLEPKLWRALASEGADHAQHDAAALFKAINLPRDAARPWAESPTPPLRARQRLMSQVMRPAPVTDAWMSAREAIVADAEAGLKGAALVEAESAREEAAAIALIIREAIETPGRTVALVTPDRLLGRRVAAHLSRWGIAADDSAGRPLGLTPPGVFARLLAQAALTPQAGPVDALALWKHPLARAGMDRGEHMRATRNFELLALRGPALAPGFAGMRAALMAAEPSLKEGGRKDALLDWFDACQAALAPLAALAERETTLPVLAEAHRAAAEALVGGDAGPLWDKEAGAGLAGYFEDLIDQGESFGPLPASAYPGLFGAFLAGRAARTPFGLHPRVFIWGTLEARSQTADMMVLGGLNEGVWPALPEVDPWINRPMRAAAGLPPPEAEIGRDAADFLAGCLTPSVFLTRAKKEDGAPTTASRWLLRLTNLLEGFAPARLAALRDRGRAYLAGAALLDAPGLQIPAPRPMPAPPREARPDRISVTEVETLIRDPYAVYARRVLGLEPLSDVAEAPDARERGHAAHGALERFIQETMVEWPEDALERLSALIEEETAGLSPWPVRQAFWRAQLGRMAEQFVTAEAARRATNAPQKLEVSGRLAFDARCGPEQPVRPFTLRARADRVDLASGEGYVIYDYKTGAFPTSAQAEAGFAQQLPLQGAIARAGGFDDLPPKPIGALAYLDVSGRSGREVRIPKDGEADALSAQAWERLQALINRYEDPNHPYPPRQRPMWISHDSPYDHLSRYGEWLMEGGEE